MCDNGEPPAKRARYNLRSYSTNLLDVNDDCLDEIFGHLDVIDLCSVKRVCKQFQQLAELQFKRKFNEFDFSTLHGDRLISRRKVRAVLCNFGYMIKSATIPRKAFHNHDIVGHVEAGLLNDVVECCGKTIRTLKLKNFAFSSNAVNALNMLSSLQSLSLLECVVAANCVFHLSNFSSLTRLDISDTLDLRPFKDVFPALEYFGLDNVFITSNNTLQKFILTHKQLKMLEILDCDGFSSDVFTSIGKNMENLEKLYFAANQIDESMEQIQNNIQQLGKLKKLQELFWFCGSLSIGNLLTKMMSNKIAMKTLFFGDGVVDSETIKAIKEMKNLNILGFHRTIGLENRHLIEIVQEVTHLKELCIGWQQNITFDVLKNVVRHTKELRELEIGSDKYPLDLTMYNDILDIVKERRNGIKLTIMIDSSDVQELIPQQTIHINKHWLIIKRGPIIELN